MANNRGIYVKVNGQWQEVLEPKVQSSDIDYVNLPLYFSKSVSGIKPYYDLLNEQFPMTYGPSWNTSLRFRKLGDLNYGGLVDNADVTRITNFVKNGTTGTADWDTYIKTVLIPKLRSDPIKYAVFGLNSAGVYYKSIASVFIKQNGVWCQSYPSYGSQEITKIGTTTFKVPPGITKLYVPFAGAAGGAGGSAFADSNEGFGQSGAGGNSGEYVRNLVIPVTPHEEIKVIINPNGRPGTRTTTISPDGATGGDLIVSTLAGNVTLKGGTGGLGGRLLVPPGPPAIPPELVVSSTWGGASRAFGVIAYGGTGGLRYGDGYSGGGGKGGTFAGADGGGNGGSSNNSRASDIGNGGGGAGGYGGVGGFGGYGYGQLDGSTYWTGGAGTLGAGGGGGLGGNDTGGGGGGVGIYGKGANGASSGYVWPASGPIKGGKGGSGGTDGDTGGGYQDNRTSQQTGNGGLYGGGGGGADRSAGARKGGDGGNGAVRIVWPGDVCQFPTFKVKQGEPDGEKLFLTSEYWVVPPGVTSVSVVCVGGGGAGAGYDGTTAADGEGGGGGALAYKNNIPVVPGEVYTIIVGQGGKSKLQGHLAIG